MEFKDDILKEEIYKQLVNLPRFREKLVDDFSKEFLDSYIQYLLYQDRSFLTNTIDGLVKCSKEVRPEGDFAEFMKGREDSKIIVFGAGQDGRKTKILLDKMNMSPEFFCDNNEKLWGSKVDGVEVIDPKTLIYQYRDHIVIIASGNYGDVLFKQLLKFWYPQKNIYYSPYGALRADIGWQYFDLPYFSKDEQEVFVDCGCHEAETCRDFIRWCDGEYKQIYAFEPDKRSFSHCKSTMRNEDRVLLIPKGAYSKTATLRFHEDGGASRIEDGGNIEIDVTSIDEVLDGERATFIKMDIEGAELDALKGAEKTIQAYYPKLAVCMYHKMTDLIAIPEYLMHIAPEYKYAIRVYTSSFCETVLYAWKE